MRTIDNQWGSLAQGYEEVKRLEAKLLEDWGSQVQRARQKRTEKELVDWEARKRRFEAKNPKIFKKYDQEMARWKVSLEEYSLMLEQWRLYQEQVNREQNRLTLWMILGGILSVLLIVSLYGIPLVTLPGYLIYRQYQKVTRLKGKSPQQPRPPKRPQPFDYESRLGPQPSYEKTLSVSLGLMDMWWKGLCIRDEPERGYGMEGVTQLLDKLAVVLPDQYFAFQELLVTQHLDVDVMIIGPSGIWLLESKFWAGQVICNKGTWFQVKDVYQHRGKPEKKVTTFEIHPDDQWLREQSMVAETLRRRLAEHPWILKHLHGGLAFTHPDVQLEIDRSCKVQWGKPEDWIPIITESKPVSLLSEEVQLKVAEVILLFASIVDSSKPRKSAVALAQQLYSAAIKDAKAYTSKWGREKR